MSLFQQSTRLHSATNVGRYANIDTVIHNVLHIGDDVEHTLGAPPQSIIIDLQYQPHKFSSVSLGDALNPIILSQ